MEKENSDTRSEMSVYMDTEAFSEVLATVRSRKPKEKSKKEKTKTSISETENKKRARKEEVIPTPQPEPPEEEDTEERELTEEEKNALRITTKIRERLKVRREQRKEAKKEEKRRKMEEWAKWHVPRENTSRSTISSSSTQAEDVRKRRALKRQQLPLSVVCAHLKDFMATEKVLQDDFLQTIRVLRGNDESENDEEPSKMEEEPTTVMESPVASPLPENNTPSQMEEEQKDPENEVNEVDPANPITPVEENPREPSPGSEKDPEQDQKPPSPLPEVHEDKPEEPEKKPRKKRRIKSKVDHRWPKGHSHFSRPAIDDVKMRLLSSLEMAYILEESTADTPALANKDLHKPFHDCSKNRRQDQLEFEQWREEMMKIAYDKEFSKGKDKMFYWVPLPDIASNARRITAVNSRNQSTTANTSHSFYNDNNETLKSRSDKSIASYIQNGAISPYFARETQLNSRSRTSNKIENNEKMTQDFGMYDTRRFKRHQHNKSDLDNSKQNDDMELNLETNNSISNDEKETTNNSRKNTSGSKRDSVSRESTDSAINMPSIHSSEASVNTPDHAGRTANYSAKDNKDYNDVTEQRDDMQGSNANVKVLVQTSSDRENQLSRLLLDVQNGTGHHHGDLKIVIDNSDMDDVDWIFDSIDSALANNKNISIEYT